MFQGALIGKFIGVTEVQEIIPISCVNCFLALLVVEVIELATSRFGLVEMPKLWDIGVWNTQLFERCLVVERIVFKSADVGVWNPAKLDIDGLAPPVRIHVVVGLVDYCIDELRKIAWSCAIGHSSSLGVVCCRVAVEFIQVAGKQALIRISHESNESISFRCEVAYGRIWKDGYERLEWR